MIAFAVPGLDRADHIRSDSAGLAAAKRGARLLRLDGVEPVVADGDLDWLPLGDVAGELVFLGLADGIAHFAAVPSSVIPATLPPWLVIEQLSPPALAIWGTARALVLWHATHRFCPRCGGGTVLAKAGWQRDCMACDASQFPRTDPVAIMAVEHGDRLLLGRQPQWPPGRFSALAGFVEPGETIEAAVAREVFEEAGVRAVDVRYLASQPWPFPHSLMIACFAAAQDDALTVDHSELEDARWFTREEVRAAMAGEPGAPFLPPPPRAIAWLLLDEWLRRGPAAPAR